MIFLAFSHYYYVNDREDGPIFFQGRSKIRQTAMQFFHLLIPRPPQNIRKIQSRAPATMFFQNLPGSCTSILSASLWFDIFAPVRNSTFPSDKIAIASPLRYKTRFFAMAVTFSPQTPATKRPGLLFRHGARRAEQLERRLARLEAKVEAKMQIVAQKVDIGPQYDYIQVSKYNNGKNNRKSTC